MQNYYRMEVLRKKNGLSQAKVAEILGTTQQQYQLYESGKREIPLHLMIVLADYYEVSLDFLVGREEPEQKQCKDVG